MVLFQKTVPYQRLSINGWRTSWLGSVAAEDQGLGYAWSMRVCVCVFFVAVVFSLHWFEALPLCFVQMAQTMEDPDILSSGTCPCH